MDKLQWGNRKKLRCVKVKAEKNSSSSMKSDGGGGSANVVAKRRITSRYADNNTSHHHHSASLPPLPSPHRNNRESGSSRLNANENQKAAMILSPEKEDRYYTTRGSSVGFDDNCKLFGDAKEDKKKFVWPRLMIPLSSKEKEEDFMAMKGCKPSQRPKKRPKLIQKSLLLVSPGAWLSDLCQERYEVREKKTAKKKPRGLKAMGGSMESDSE